MFEPPSLWRPNKFLTKERKTCQHSGFSTCWPVVETSEGAIFVFFESLCFRGFFLDSPGPKKWFGNPSLHMMSFYYSFAHISAAQLSAGIPIGFCWQRPRGKEIDPTPDSPNMQRYYSLVSEIHFTTQRAEEIRNATQLLFVICWWFFIDEGRLSNKKGPSSVLYTYWWSST